MALRRTILLGLAAALALTVSERLCAAEMTTETFTSLFSTVDRLEPDLALAYNETTSAGQNAVKYGDVLTSGFDQIVIAWHRQTEEYALETLRDDLCHIAVVTTLSPTILHGIWDSGGYGGRFGSAHLTEIDKPGEMEFYEQCRAASFALDDLTGDGHPEIIAGRFAGRTSMYYMTHEIWSGAGGTMKGIFFLEGRLRIIPKGTEGSTETLVEAESYVDRGVHKRYRWNGRAFEDTSTGLVMPVEDWPSRGFDEY